MNREQTVMMTRVKNEEVYIKRCLASVWPVAQTVVVFDDNSTDDTDLLCIGATVGTEFLHAALDKVGHSFEQRGVWKLDTDWIDGYSGERRVLHYINSLFGDVRAEETVNEYRDKEVLWNYLKSSIEFDTVICLDGDEALSREAVRNFDQARALLATHDALELRVFYLWDAEDQVRIDGVYGNIRHPRIFTIRHLTAAELFQTRFVWSGSNAGFHIGSIPRDGFPQGLRTSSVFFSPLVHYGYLSDAVRQRKFEFYTRLDARGQDGYEHIIGKPNRQAPGPIKFRKWLDN